MKERSEFVALVAQMREAQRAYFRTQGGLSTAKELERRVDREIERITKRQPDLFDKE